MGWNDAVADTAGGGWGSAVAEIPQDALPDLQRKFSVQAAIDSNPVQAMYGEISPTGEAGVLPADGGMNPVSVFRDYFKNPDRKPVYQGETIKLTPAERMQAADKYVRSKDLDATKEFIKKTSFASGLFTAQENHHVKKASERIARDEATSEDYHVVAQYFEDARRLKERTGTVLGQTLELASALPMYAGEFAATGGGFTAGARGVGQLALGKLGWEASKQGLTRLAVKGVGGAAGVAAQTALNPQNVAANATKRMIPELGITQDDAGEAQVVITKQGDGFASALPKGFLDTYIELGTERLGGAIPKGAGKAAFGMLPKATQAAVESSLKASVMTRWLASSPGRTVREFNQILAKAGWNGPVSEMLEERAGEVAKGVTGLDDFGTTGDIVTGKFGKAGKQLMSEGLAFMLPMAGSHAVGIATNESPLASGEAPGKFHPEQARMWAEDNPSEAERLASYLDKNTESSPAGTVSRGAWHEVGLPDNINGNKMDAADRAQFAQLAKAYLASQPTLETDPTAQPTELEGGGVRTKIGAHPEFAEENTDNVRARSGAQGGARSGVQDTPTPETTQNAPPPPPAQQPAPDQQELVRRALVEEFGSDFAEFIASLDEEERQPPAAPAAPVASPASETTQQPPAAVEAAGDDLGRIGEAGKAIADNMYTAIWDDVQKGGGQMETQNPRPSIAAQFWNKLIASGHQPTPELFDRWKSLASSGAFDSGATASQALAEFKQPTPQQATGEAEQAAMPVEPAQPATSYPLGETDLDRMTYKQLRTLADAMGTPPSKGKKTLPTSAEPLRILMRKQLADKRHENFLADKAARTRGQQQMSAPVSAPTPPATQPAQTQQPTPVAPPEPTPAAPTQTAPAAPAADNPLDSWAKNQKGNPKYFLASADDTSDRAIQAGKFNAFISPEEAKSGQLPPVLAEEIAAYGEALRRKGHAFGKPVFSSDRLSGYIEIPVTPVQGRHTAKQSLTDEAGNLILHDEEGFDGPTASEVEQAKAIQRPPTIQAPAAPTTKAEYFAEAERRGMKPAGLSLMTVKKRVDAAMEAERQEAAKSPTTTVREELDAIPVRGAREVKVPSGSREYSAVAKLFDDLGVDVRWYTADGSLLTAMTFPKDMAFGDKVGSGRVWIPVNADEKHLWAMAGDELAHAIGLDKRSQAFSEAEVNAAVDEYIGRWKESLDILKAKKFSADTAKQIKQHEVIIQRLLTDNAIARREGIGHLVSKALMVPAFRNELLAEKPSIFRQLVDAVVEFLTGKTKLTTTQETLLREFRQYQEDVPSPAQVTRATVASMGMLSAPVESIETPEFYSKAREVIEKWKGSKGDSAQIVAMLNNAGLKQDEIADLELEQLGTKGKLTKQQVLDHIDQAIPDVQWEYQADAQPWVSDTRRTFDGLMDYFHRGVAEVIPNGREFSIFINDKEQRGMFRTAQEAMLAADDIIKRDVVTKLANGELTTKEAQKLLAVMPTQFSGHVVPGGTNYREIVARLPGVKYQGHFGQDAIAHLRVDDVQRGDKKYLRIQEIQSDLHQKGAKEGYGDKIEWEVTIWNEEEGTAQTQRYKHKEEAEAAASYHESPIREVLLGVTPNAPFKNTWRQLMLKKAVKMAAEEGYDGVELVKGADIAKAVGGPVEELGKFYDEIVAGDLRAMGKKHGAKLDKVESTVHPDTANVENIFLRLANGDIRPETAKEKIEGQVGDISAEQSQLIEKLSYYVEKGTFLPHEATEHLLGRGEGGGSRLDFTPAMRAAYQQPQPLWAAPNLDILTAIDYKEGRKKAFNWFVKWWTPQGGRPAVVDKGLKERKHIVDAHVHDAHHHVRTFDDAIKSDYGKGWDKLTPAEQDSIRQVVEGAAPSTTLPPATARAATIFRTIVDSLTIDLVSASAMGRQASLSSLGNLGKYMNRAYKIFDDPMWYKKVPVPVRAAAHSALQSQNPSATAHQIDNYIDDILQGKDTAFSRSPTNARALIKSANKISKDLSITINRKNVPKWLRDLMGEYDDPRVNFLRTVAKQASLLETHRLLTDVANQGTGVFLFRKDDPKRPKGFTHELAAETSSAMSPLNGLMTTPEIAQALEKTFSSEKFLPTVTRAILAANLAAKFGSTALNPLTQQRNFLGNFMFLIGQGWLGPQSLLPSRAKASANGLAVALQTVLVEAGALEKTGKTGYKWVTGKPLDTEAWREVSTKLVRLGVTGTAMGAGELADSLQDLHGSGMLDFLGLAVDEKKAPIAKGAVSVASAPFKAAAFQYKKSDDFWRVIAFYTERQRWKDAMPNATDEWLDERAASRVRDGMQTYEELPEALKRFRYSPVGPFVMYPADTIRIATRTFKNAWEELNDPNWKVKQIGAERLVGVLTVAAIPTMLSAASMLMMGVSWDEDKARRRFEAPWDRNGQFLYLGRKPDNTLIRMNLSHLDAFAYLRKPVLAFFNGGDVEEKLKQAGGEMIQPFVSEQIITGKLLDVARNAKFQGGQTPRTVHAPYAYAAGGSTARQAMLDDFWHIMTGVTPGIVKQGMDTKSGLEGRVSAGGKEYDATNEAIKMAIGMKVDSVDFRQGLSFRASGFARNMQEATRRMNSKATNRGHIPLDELEASYNETEAARRAMFDEMHDSIADAMKLGMSLKEVDAVLKNSGMAEQPRADLIGGHYEPFVPSDQSEELIFSRPEGAKRIELLRSLALKNSPNQNETRARLESEQQGDIKAHAGKVARTYPLTVSKEEKKNGITLATKRAKWRADVEAAANWLKAHNVPVDVAVKQHKGSGESKARIRARLAGKFPAP